MGWTSRGTPLDLGRLSLRGAAVAILAIAACGGGAGGGGCGGGGCLGGCGDGTYEYPKDDPNRPDAILQQETARVRITQAFIDFIKPQLPNLIKETLDGASGMEVRNDVLYVDIPNTSLFNIGVASAELRDAKALIWLDDLDQRLDLRFETPNSVRLVMANLRFGVQADLRENVAGTTSSCPIVGELGGTNPRHAAEISINAVLDPGVGPDPDRNFDIRIEVDDIALNSLDVGIGDYCAEPQCQDCVLQVGGTCLDPGGRCAECHIFCGGITSGLLTLVTSLIDLVRPLLNRVLKPIVQNFIRSALADFNNQPAALEMQVNLGDIVGIDALKAANPFGIFVAPEPGRFPVVDRGTGDGMEITTTGGAEAELADCVGDLELFNMPKGPVPVLGGTDSMGRPYHAGMTIAVSLVNQILYAVHRSGTLCLKLGSEDIKGLTGGAFSLNASVLSLLASDLSLLADDAAPVILQLKPNNPPIVDLGSGEVTGQDMMGNDIYDWLLKMNLEDMGIAFHVLMQDRYVRIFEVTMDLNIGLNITVLPDNSLEVAVGELRIDGFEETFNEILPNADFAMVLPTLIDLVLQALISNQLSFNLDLTDTLSSALGGAPIFMRINDIMRDGIQEDYLTLTMTFTSSRSFNLSLAAETYARLAEQDGLHERLTRGDRRPTGRIRLVVGEVLDYTDQHALEYQVRVDRGLWRAARRPRPDGTLFVEAPVLRLPGMHKVEVRARYIDDYETLDATPAVLDVLVDPEPPSVTAVIAQDAVQVRVFDRDSPAEMMTLLGRFDDGQWFAIDLAIDEAKRISATVPLEQFGSAKILELKAVDGANNASGVLPVSFEVPEAIPVDEIVACGCHEVPGSAHGHGEALFGLLALGALLALRRRS